MKAKETIILLSRWAEDNHKQPLDMYRLQKKDWGFAKRLGSLFNSKLQFQWACTQVNKAGGFKYGYLTPYSYTVFKNILKDLGDLSYERPNYQTTRKN